MTRQAQKDLERRYLESVRTLLTDFPVGRIEDKECPDFLVHAANRVIGIEITELHQVPDGQPLPLQAREAVRQKIVDRAKTIYDGAGHPPVDCKLHLKDLPYRKSDIEPLATSIAELARRNIPPDGELCLVEEYDWMNAAYFPDVVDRIRVARYGVMTESFFSADGTAWIGPMPPDLVREAIDVKGAHIDEYLRRCDEAWLAIVADGFRMSTWFVDDAQVRASSFVTPFARVFVLRTFGRQLTELATVRPSSRP